MARSARTAAHIEATFTARNLTALDVFQWDEHDKGVNPGDLILEAQIGDAAFVIRVAGRDMRYLAEQAAQAARRYEENAEWLSAPVSTRPAPEPAPLPTPLAGMVPLVQAAREAKADYQRLYRMAKRGELDVTRHGRKFYVYPASVANALRTAS